MRLIDADDTSKVFLKIMNLPVDYCGPSDIMISIDAAFSVLGQVPDVDPVKYGSWRSCGHGVVKCSRCGKRFYGVYDDDRFDNYCRNCGAKMGGLV